MKAQLILIIICLVGNFSIAQEQLPFLDEKDSLLVFKQNGELYLSGEELATIDELVFLDNYKLITSIKFPGQIFVYDQNNLLQDKIVLKGKGKGAVAGLYQVGHRAFLATRPENSLLYTFELKRGKVQISKNKLQLNGSKKIYYQKEIISPNGNQLIHFDSYGIDSDGNNIEAAVLFKKTNEAPDTISVIKKTNETTFLNPYKSSNYEISMMENYNCYAIQNFKQGIILVINESGKLIDELDLKQLASDHNSELIRGYFAGQYDYFSRIIYDPYTHSSYLYIGTFTNTKSNGMLFKWDNLTKSWKKLPFENLPFLNILAIKDSTLYFKLRINESQQGIYRSDFKKW
ncbi:hypothetical protein [Roseivirga sp.]|uniref:hypothetical protein n=1 Tax=Roseivirga sp. TaxID=1964215 RepID=UPI003B52F0FB